METNDTNDYHLNYSKEWSKPKSNKRKAKGYQLIYFNKIEINFGTYAVCKAKQNELKRSKYYNEKMCKIKPIY